MAHEERMLVIHRLHEVLRPFVLRRVKSAVLGQLPEKVEKVVRVDLTAWQKVLYEQIRATGAAAQRSDSPAPPDGETPGGAAVARPAASRGLNNVLMQLRKVCNHPFLFRTDAWTVARPSGDHTKMRFLRAPRGVGALLNMPSKFGEVGLDRKRDAAVTLRREISTSRPRRRRDSSPRNIHVAAAASPRLFAAEYPRLSRGVAASERNSRATGWFPA